MLAVPIKYFWQQLPLLILQHTSAISHLGQAAEPCPSAPFTTQCHASRCPNSCSSAGGRLFPYSLPFAIQCHASRRPNSCSSAGGQLFPYSQSPWVSFLLDEEGLGSVHPMFYGAGCWVWGCSRCWGMLHSWQPLLKQHNAETKMSNGSEAWCLWHPWMGRKSHFASSLFLENFLNVKCM